MNGYHVFINGTNFLVDVGAGLGKHGFGTNIFVEANDPKQAEKYALDLMQSHNGLEIPIHNTKDDPPKIEAEEIEPIGNYEEIDPKVQGLIWYSEEKSPSFFASLASSLRSLPLRSPVLS